MLGWTSLLSLYIGTCFIGKFCQESIVHFISIPFDQIIIKIIFINVNNFYFIVTNSSAAVGCIPIVESKSDFFAPAFIDTAIP